MVWSLLDICPIVQISFSTSLTCHLDMWWSGVTWLERSVPGSLGGPLAFLVFPVCLLCPVAGHLLLRSETQVFMVSSLSLVLLQWLLLLTWTHPVLDDIVHPSWDLRAAPRWFSAWTVYYFPTVLAISWLLCHLFSLAPRRIQKHLDSFQGHIAFPVCLNVHREPVSWLKGLCVSIDVCCKYVVFLYFQRLLPKELYLIWLKVKCL